MVHWTRLPSALTPNGDWDGSLTILDGTPVIMYDCYNIPDCLPVNSTAASRVTGRTGSGRHFRANGDGAAVGDPPHVGVAHPVDPTDPHLLSWAKDPLNPIYFPGMGGGSLGHPISGK